MKAAQGPSTALSRMPPITCPLEPVPGIEKLIICAANTKAPITPMSGMMSSRRMFFTFEAATAMRVAATAPAPAAMAGDTSASAMCMVVLVKEV